MFAELLCAADLNIDVTCDGVYHLVLRQAICLLFGDELIYSVKRIQLPHGSPITAENEKRLLKRLMKHCELSVLAS